MRQEIIEKYKTKKFGYLYNGKEYGVEDLLNIDNLSHILANTFTSESHLNNDAMNFLKEYYGLENLASELEKRGGIEDDLKSHDQIFSWLNDLEKMSDKYST